MISSRFTQYKGHLRHSICKHGSSNPSAMSAKLMDLDLGGGGRMTGEKLHAQ